MKSFYYSGDPYWTTARFNSKCSSCRRGIPYTHSNQKERKKAVELLCEKSRKPAKKGANPLHIRYTKKDDRDFRAASSLFSVN